MAIFTKNEFSQLTASKTQFRNLSSIVNEARLFSKSSSTTSIFISHAHTDKNLIKEAIVFFRTLNSLIYVDWMDETMPEKPNGVTASKIKLKISGNDKFILLATDAAIISKWCNWEIGIGDAYKLNSDKICLLPLAESNGHWTGNEYLQIYPRIESLSISNRSAFDGLYKIKYPDGKEAWLDEWLKK